MQHSYLPGERPPVPPGVRRGRPDRENRDFIGPAPADKGSGRFARLDNPAAAGVIAFAGWLAFILARLAGWAAGHVSKFILSGTTYSHPALMVPKILHVHGKGYDGQFYYRFGFNPFNWHLTAYGITIDHPYRYTRIGYSVAAWIASFGGHGELLPTVLVLVNLVCVAAMGWLGGVFAREAGRHALWGLLVAGYFGLVISVGRDTSEPLADALMLSGLLAYRHRRFGLAAALVSYAVFTNEPVLALPVALALTRLWLMWQRQVRFGVADLVWLAPGLVYLLLQGIAHLVVTGTAGGVADASANLTWPFHALGPGVYRDVARLSWTHLGRYDYNLIEFLVLGVFVAAGFAVLRATTAPLHERVAFVCFVALEMVIASGQFWDSIFGDGRTYVDAYVMAVVLLLATPARAVAGPAGLAGPAVLAGPARVAGPVGRGAHRARAPLSGRLRAPRRVITGQQLGGLAALAVAALVIVARRRILFM